MATSRWLTDPALAGRFHPEHPNDLQVLLHDGEPRRTSLAPEAAWVKVTGVHGTMRLPSPREDATTLPLDRGEVSWSDRPVYAGTLLNAPAHLLAVHRGDVVLFVHAPGLPYPLQITETYLAERSDWAIVACRTCGADQALDPPSVMARTRFPDSPAGATHVAFTAFCPCGGIMTLCKVATTAAGDERGRAPSAPKPWWKIW